LSWILANCFKSSWNCSTLPAGTTIIMPGRPDGGKRRRTLFQVSQLCLWFVWLCQRETPSKTKSYWCEDRQTLPSLRGHVGAIQ
jgi:hypothetical protein